MARIVGAVAMLGVALGIFSVVGDGLPADSPLIVLVALANSFGPWIVVAFVAGAFAGASRPGALAGAATLLIGVLTYYVGYRVVRGDVISDLVRATLVVVRTCRGRGGRAGRCGWDLGGRRRALARRQRALLSGLLLAEALARFVEVEGWTGIDLARTALQVAAVDLATALIVPSVILEPSDASAYAATCRRRRRVRGARRGDGGHSCCADRNSRLSRPQSRTPSRWSRNRLRSRPPV